MSPSQGFIHSLLEWLRNGPLRNGILGLIICACATLIGTEAWQLSQVHRANIEQTDIVSSNTARAMAEQAETTLQTADTVVATLVKQVEEEGTGKEALTRFYRLMTSLALALPAIHEMGIVDSQGNAIAKSLKPDPHGLNYSEREYFRYHATHADRGPFIGARIQSKIDGTYSITVTRRINNPDGSFGGLAVTSVSLDFFQQLFNRVQARSGGVISLISDDDTILARSPNLGPDKKKGTKLSDLRHARDDPSSGSLFYVSGSDGVRRRGSYDHLSHFPVSAWVSQSEWDIQRSWRTEMITHAIILGCVMTVLLTLGRQAMTVSRMLSRQAMHDGLTGLANRRAFDETLEREIRRAARSGQPLSVIMIDIDHFKTYNDCFGHPAGDECLRVVARTIQGCLKRSGELAARYGGEELVVLLPGSDATGALAIAETMRLAVRGVAIQQAPRLGGVVTFSAGVATCMPEQVGDDSQTLVRLADAALYAAKLAGRDTVRA
jgi:diguanylate cyclase (GGDEF)-like protein